jgi:hypothetical protein
MSQQDLLRRVIETVEGAQVDYMLTGSLASSLQGEPRSTHDIDLVVAVLAPGRAFATALAQAFPSPDYHLDEGAVLEAVRTRGCFNLIDVQEGTKVDFWILTEEPFDQCRFGRKYDEEYAGTKLRISRPEDTILMKLRWSELSGGSERQYLDALRVYEVQHGTLEHPYLDHWAHTLGVDALYQRLKAEAKPL